MYMRSNVTRAVWALVIAGAMSTAVFAAEREAKVEDRLDASADTLMDMMRASDHGIPQDLIDKARCVVVIPGMKKAGFIIGAKYGRGFAVCRRHGGVGWSAPASVRSEGGSFGFQIGGSDTDVVLLVNGDKGMTHLLEDKFMKTMWRPLGENAGLSLVPSPKVSDLVAPVDRSSTRMSKPGPLRAA